MANIYRINSKFPVGNFASGFKVKILEFSTFFYNIELDFTEVMRAMKVYRFPKRLKKLLNNKKRCDKLICIMSFVV